MQTNNTLYKRKQRALARKKHRCSICISRKTRKGHLTCTRCSKNAGARRDRKVSRSTRKRSQQK